MSVLPGIISREWHKEQIRFLAAIAKVAAEATPEERQEHERALSVAHYCMCPVQSVMSKRLNDLLASDWMREEIPDAQNPNNFQKLIHERPEFTEEGHG